MAETGLSAATMIDQQVKELDAIATRTIQDFNTTLGTERMGQWKIRTVALLQQHAGHRTARVRFASSLAAALLDGLFAHPAVILPPTRQVS